MYGKSGSAEQYQRIAFTEAETVGHAEKIKTCQSQNDADPDNHPRAFFLKDAEDGNQNDIQGGDEAGFTDGGIGDTVLLQGTGNRNNQAAAETADKQ